MSPDRILLALAIAVLAFAAFSAHLNPVGRWQVAAGGFDRTYLVDTRTGLVCAIYPGEELEEAPGMFRELCTEAPTLEPKP
jgi:hypothetical protein